MKRLLLVAALLTASCAHRAPPPPMPAPTAKDLPPPDAIPGAFAIRQKLTAKSAHGGGSFEAVLQKKPGEVVLVGLTPFGSRAFLLRQTAAEVQFTSYISRELPFPPSYMLLDVHRVMDAWLGPAPADGARSGQVGDERIQERWSGGRLVQRTFTRVSNAAGQPPGDVTIAYEGAGPAGVASRVTLANARYGYSLTIESFPLR